MAGGSAPLDLSGLVVLVVGAGGIGCELAKTLLMSGFMRVGIADLDSIDLTNLNRQFFYRQKHVGRSKAKVLAAACNRLFSPQQRKQLAAAAAAAGPAAAAAAAAALAAGEADAATPAAAGAGAGGGGGGGGAAAAAADRDDLVWGPAIWGVRGMQCNILSPSFSVSFISSFDLVFAALDNLQARRHLNRLCLAARKPLLEAGSTGYSGQVMPIAAGETLCFDCEGKATKKDRIPICTLRQQPEKAEHCVAWAKMIYELLFGCEETDNLLTDLKKELQRITSCSSSSSDSSSSSTTDTSSSSNGSSNSNDSSSNSSCSNSTNCASNNSSSNSSSSSSCSSSDYGEVYRAGLRVLEELFAKQIKELLQLKTDWKGKAPPIPLQLHPNIQQQQQHQQQQQQQFPLHTVWTPLQCQQAFLNSFCSLMERKQRMHQQQQQQQQQQQRQVDGIPFDKDDELAMDFVAAAASIRMATFHIDPKTRWDLQAIAGAIIPAIASTNAIVAGLQVVEALHLLHSLAQKNSSKRKHSNEQQQQHQQPQQREEEEEEWVWVKPFVSGKDPENFGRLLLPEPLERPRSSCYVCQQLTITVKLASLQEWSLFDFCNSILKEGLGCSNPFLDSAHNLLDPEEMASNAGQFSPFFFFLAFSSFLLYVSV
ncbi:hypothetical protein Efla_001405 [Eimeria flavescens]